MPQIGRFHLLCRSRGRVKPNPNQPYKYGKAWGVYHWNGKQIGSETKIGGVAKKQWILDPEQSLADKDLLRSLLAKAEKAEAQEAA
mmetsp:Transcript_24699/g.55624  ORF Transcript_24699/g.55624 Transcript_24699/m.55624 type:complete len:86 (-) Transcript_24699:307-564(-)